ncbi:hypothetical protein EBT31_18650 [bacterium]|nr:hypothetical protein [bacterium]
MEEEAQILQRLDAVIYKVDMFEKRLRAIERRILELEHETASAAGEAPALLKSIRELQGAIGDQTPSVKELLNTFSHDKR